MAKAKDRVSDVKPYVKRALQDEELRDSLRSAFDTARDVYDELIGGRGVTAVAGRVATDKDIQDQLRSAIEDLRDAADRIQELFLAGRRDEATNAVPDEYVDEGALLGSPDRIAKRYQPWAECGITGLTIHADQDEAVELMAELARPGSTP